MESLAGHNDRWLCAEDFLWYSAESFLGIDVSDVGIVDVIYEDVREDEIYSLYFDQFENARAVTKMLNSYISRFTAVVLMIYNIYIKY